MEWVIWEWMNEWCAARCIAIVMRDVSSSAAQREKRTHQSQGHSLTYRPQGQGPTPGSEGHNLTHQSQGSNPTHQSQGQNLKHRYQGHILTLMSKSRDLTYRSQGHSSRSYSSIAASVFSYLTETWNLNVLTLSFRTFLRQKRGTDET